MAGTKSNSGTKAVAVPDPAGRERGNREQRSGRNRRQRTFPPIRYLLAGGRRRNVRRSDDQQRIVILDRYSPKLFASIVGILCLSLLDAVLTLYLMENGSSELNPVMGYFLNKGPFIFTLAKYLLTSVAVIIFLAVANSVLPRSNFQAQKLFPFALIAFGSVVLWEIMLVCILIVQI